MQQDILINWSPQETRVAVVETGALQEIHVERTLERGLVGNVYIGKVARVLPGMQSAFIDIGLERAAFLHVADLMSSVTARHADSDQANPAPILPIEKQVFEGQSLMVQVIKDPDWLQRCAFVVANQYCRPFVGVSPARSAYWGLPKNSFGAT